MITTIFYQIKKLPKFSASPTVASAKFWWRDAKKKQFNADKVIVDYKNQKRLIAQLFYNDESSEVNAFNKTIDILYGAIPTTSDDLTSNLTSKDKSKGMKLISKLGSKTVSMIKEKVKQYATATSQISALTSMGILIFIYSDVLQSHLTNATFFDEQYHDKIFQAIKEHTNLSDTTITEIFKEQNN